MKSQAEIDKSLNEQVSKAEKVIDYHEVKGTPFMIVEHVEDQKFFGAMGNRRLTEYCKSKDEAERVVTQLTWDRLTQVMYIVAQEFINLPHKQTEE